MKKFVAALLFLTFAFVPAFSWSGEDVNARLGSFANAINATIPNAATEQNVYSSAWIGKLFPSAPPRLAIGVEAGVTRLDTQPLKDAARIFGVTGLPGMLAYPTLTANARIGGFFLPFDIGFSAMYLNLNKLESIADGLGFRFFDIGGDFRWAVLKGEGPQPQLSVGAGYYYTSGDVSYSKEGLYTKMEYATHTAFVQAQVSKTFIFFTPYLGFRGIFSKSEAKWNWQVSAERILAASNYSSYAYGGAGRKESDWFKNFMPQVYGGFGLNFGFFALNFSAAYEFVNKIWGGNLSIRFQM